MQQSLNSVFTFRERYGDTSELIILEILSRIVQTMQTSSGLVFSMWAT